MCARVAWFVMMQGCWINKTQTLTDDWGREVLGMHKGCKTRLDFKSEFFLIFFGKLEISRFAMFVLKQNTCFGITSIKF